MTALWRGLPRWIPTAGQMPQFARHMTRGHEAEAELLRTSIALTKAAGGEIFVPMETLSDAPLYHLERYYDPCRYGYVFRVQWR